MINPPADDWDDYGRYDEEDDAVFVSPADASLYSSEPVARLLDEAEDLDEDFGEPVEDGLALEPTGDLDKAPMPVPEPMPLDELPAALIAEATRKGGDLVVMPKRSLRERVSNVEWIARTIESLDPEELTDARRDELSAELIAALAGTREKVDSTAAVLAMFRAMEAAAKVERERLEKREVRYARQAQRLETYVLAILETSRLEKLEGNTSTLASRKNPPALEIDDAAAIPAEWYRHPPAPPVPPAVPDKPRIKAALLAGKKVEGCSLSNGYRLVLS